MVDRPAFDGSDLVTVRVRLTNSGTRRGSEAVQLCVAPPASRIDRPAKELKAFDKLHLAPGETAEAMMTCPHAFSYVDAGRNAFVAEKGRYRLLAAVSSAAMRGSVDIDLAREVEDVVRAASVADTGKRAKKNPDVALASPGGYVAALRLQ